MRTKNWTAALCGLATLSLPTLALAAASEPLMPLPAPPTGPQAPAAPGEPLLRGQSVTERSRPEVDPLGLHLDGFFLFPRAEVDEAYNDNIFATNTPTTSDFITVLAPSFDLLSNFPRHALNVHGGGSFGIYASHSSENFQDGFGAVDGRADISNIHHIYGGLRVERLHEDRASPDAPGNAAEPVKYNVYTGNVGASQTGLRIGWQADAAVRREEYESVPALGGGTIPQSDRNVDIYEGSLRGTYEFQPNYQAFIRAAGNSRVYDHTALGSVTRDSTGWRVDAGARIDLTGVTYAEGYVGYLSQDYRSAQLATVSGVDFGGRLVWNVTQLTTVRFDADRSVQDTNNAALISQGAPINTPGYLHTIAAVNVDHELLRNLLLNANASYANDDYKGIDRTDDTYAVGIGAKYLLNRHLYLGATYTYDHRDSTGSAAINPYSRNIILLRLSTQL